MSTDIQWIDKKFYGHKVFSPLTDEYYYIYVTDEKSKLNDVQGELPILHLKVGIVKELEGDEFTLHYGFKSKDGEITNIHRAWFEFNESFPGGADAAVMLGAGEIIRLVIEEITQIKSDVVEDNKLTVTVYVHTCSDCNASWETDTREPVCRYCSSIMLNVKFVQQKEDNNDN